MLGSIALLSLLALFIGGLALRRYLPIERWSLARDHSARALLVVVGSAVVGALYFAYLRSEPFPPDFVRVVPLLWLAGCAMGWILVVAALRFDTRKLRALAALILNVPNTLLAGIFRSLQLWATRHLSTSLKACFSCVCNFNPRCRGCEGHRRFTHTGFDCLH